MAEFQRRSHFPALDQIRVGFEDGIDLLGVGNLLSLEHTTTRLIDDALSETTIMFDLPTQFLDRQLGNRGLGANFAGVPQLPSGTLHDFIGDADELATETRLRLGAPLLVLER
jgi:hypothetical protein